MPGQRDGMHGGDVGRAQAGPLVGRSTSTDRFRDEDVLLICQNLDLDDINVRNAQFKNFDTIVRMRLKPVWHKVGAKTRIHVAALTELRNLHT